MKLYIRRNCAEGAGENFCITDENGATRYDMSFENILNERVYLFDNERNRIATIRQVQKSLMPKYQVFIGGIQILEVKRTLHSQPRCKLSGLDWEMQERGIIKGDSPVVTVERKQMGWGSSYELDIPDPQNELAAVPAAVAVTIAVEGLEALRH